MNAQENRWNINDNGGITWTPAKEASHSDHVEMSGKRVSVVFRYGVDERGFFLNQGLVFPMLRTIPNNTHASLMRKCNWNPLDLILVNGNSLLNESVKEVSMKGLLSVESDFMARRTPISLKRTYFPSTDKPAVFVEIELTNPGKNPITVEVPDSKIAINTDKTKGVYGSYRIEMGFDKNGTFSVAPGETLEIGAITAAYKHDTPSTKFDIGKEKEARQALVDQLMNNLVLETPDDVINKMFAFSKIRACESIYETKGGPLHGPGGESYYAAIWANDQAEYINPFFPFTGYEYGNKSALTSYKMFARFMNDEWKTIPSSIIAEGDDIWNGAGDRGDCAMIAYGAARYALAKGDKQEAKELWPLIEWCLEYCKRKLNSEGVVASDSDELEGRFPSGDANLCTSSLYYDALISAAYLNKELGGSSKTSADYNKRAAEIRKNIEKYFGANVQGFDTYAYYKGNDLLRSWICIPLSVGITERSEKTLDALFSPYLWTENGLLTQAGSETFWDRSTLYALRGAYVSGATERATEYLKKYSRTRLLGDHVPYAIEAWPEGEQRHLSAESGLYARIITEGLFGIHPTGFKTFDITPRLPKDWNTMSLKKIKSFGSDFDINVERAAKEGILNVTVINDGKTVCKKSVKEGTSISVRL
jgi:hypothetical protein